MKQLVILTLIVALSGSFTFAQISDSPLGLKAGTFSVSFSGGAYIPVDGKYSSTLDIKDLLETGPELGVSLNYSLSPTLSIRGSYDYAYNYFKANFRPLDKKPAFHAPMISTDLVLKFGTLISENGTINPYCFSGVGVNLWEFSSDGTCLGNVMTSAKGKDWKKASLELHTGIGTEVYLNSNISLFAEGQLRYIFSKDKENFGDDFGNLLFVKISGGLTYYFSF